MESSALKFLSEPASLSPTNISATEKSTSLSWETAPPTRYDYESFLVYAKDTSLMLLIKEIHAKFCIYPKFVI